MNPQIQNALPEDASYEDVKAMAKIIDLPNENEQKVIRNWIIAYRKRYPKASDRNVFRAAKRHFKIKK